MAKAVAAKPIKEKEWSFFGDVDRHKFSKEIQSEFPAWMMTQHLSELKESAAHRERMLKDDMVEISEKPYQQESLKKELSRIEGIAKSKPSLSAKQRDELHLEYKALASKIADSMFTYTKMMKGTADAHQEAVRMAGKGKDACIVLENVSLAFACNVTPTKDGRVNRNQASKMFKIMGKYLEQETNVETLRRD